MNDFINKKELIDVLMDGWRPDMTFQELLDLINAAQETDENYLLVLKKEGYVVHDNHIDEVVIECVELNCPEPICVYSGVCSEDDLPFSINVPLNNIDSIILSEDEAYKKLNSTEGSN